MTISAAVFLASCAIGLLAAKFTLDEMTIQWGSFLIVVVIFGVLQAILSPFVAKMVHRNATALLGGVGLLSTFIALLITSLLSSGLTIRGVTTWVLACVIVWLVTMIATMFLPLLVVKKHLRQRTAER
ncbi:superfamily IV 4 TMS phage holin [Antricoccus suffuscus]|uniref:Superfamily IV 4 TMS phage holin n=1 Tax=Antricoccus suffuscus TaxID=1629062 RepID=A0A2T1A668_9ACTN|nr:phage holin family protein [Antricoccus suffuscus]PRZ44091.1 superfamily IV 4 TMS phage holin [Antricoccus suffuscus]